MNRIPFNAHAILVARRLRTGVTPHALATELGIKILDIEKIEGIYGDVPDAVLEKIQRLMNDRDRLRAMVAALGRFMNASQRI